MANYFKSILAISILVIQCLAVSEFVNISQGQKPDPFQSSTPSGPSFQSSAVPTCSKLPVSSVKASGTQEGLSPANIIDNDVTTRWSNLGLNSWVQLDLGKQKTICSVDISWYRGNERINDFIISGSNDGINFVNLFSGKSTGLTLDFEKYDLKSAKARYIKITVTGNSQNNWISIAEVRISGYESSPPPPPNTSPTCSKLPVSSVKASGTQEGLSPANIIDNDVTTRWSNLGLNSWVQLDLGKQKTICSVDISWYRGNERINDFIISGSNDGINFVNLFSGKSTGLTLDFEKYDLKSAKARYIKITVTGNSQNNWISIAEVRISGYESTGQDTSAPSVIGTTPVTGATGVKTTGSITATFNEVVQASSINTLTFVVKNANGAGVTGAVSRTSDGKSTIFVPSSALATSTKYTATITTGVKDLANNKLVSPFSWSFTTIGSSTADFNFAAVGDWSCNSRASETIANIQNKQPELILALGDFSYESSPDCWLEKIKDIEGITRVTIGNHDSAEEESSNLEKQYLERFNLKQPYYSFDYKNAHFLMLSSQLDAKKGDAQYNFAENDLNKASQNKNIHWIFVALHKPLYTSPTEHSAETDFRNVYHPLFDKYGIDLVLQAHNHNYQRSYPISYNSQKSSSPTATDSSLSSYTDPKGVIFVIAGTGGRSLYDLVGQSPFIVTQHEEYGMLDVKITNGGKKLIGTFHANDEGRIEDTFTITKK